MQQSVLNNFANKVFLKISKYSYNNNCNNWLVDPIQSSLKTSENKCKCVFFNVLQLSRDQPMYISPPFNDLDHGKWNLTQSHA